MRDVRNQLGDKVTPAKNREESHGKNWSHNQNARGDINKDCSPGVVCRTGEVGENTRQETQNLSLLEKTSLGDKYRLDGGRTNGPGRDVWKKVVTRRVEHLEAYERQQGHHYEWKPNERRLERSKRLARNAGGVDREHEDLDFACTYPTVAKFADLRQG